MPMEPPSCCSKLFMDVAVAVWNGPTELSNAVDTGATSRLMPSPRIIMETMIQPTEVPGSIREKKTKEMETISIPATEIFRVTPLTAIRPANGRVTRIINALGSINRPDCISENPTCPCNKNGMKNMPPNNAIDLITTTIAARLNVADLKTVRSSNGSGLREDRMKKYSDKMQASNPKINSTEPNPFLDVEDVAYCTDTMNNEKKVNPEVSNFGLDMGIFFRKPR